jgi:hypothetical protein
MTGGYEVTGKSPGASTAKRTADGGQGAAIGAGVGAGAGAGSEIMTKGDHVRVPSATLLDFMLQQDVSYRRARARPSSKLICRGQSFVTGHDFSRAARVPINEFWALAPARIHQL